MFKHALCSALLGFSLVAAPLFAADKNHQFDTLLKSFHDINQFNGSVLIAQDGNTLFEKGYGYANFEWQIPNSPDTKFRIGSITKQFTAMLIMQLVEQGKIALHEPITAYLPNYRKDTGDKITVHHLLNHTSGIPSYTGFKHFRDKISKDYYDVDTFITEFCSRDLEFSPGSKFRYNNSGYFILGGIIEKVTGKTYTQVLEDQILKPLGMQNTGYDWTAPILPKRASGYSRNLIGINNAAYLDMSLPYAAGSMYSTVQDLVIWDKALRDNKLLIEKHKLLMFQGSEHKNYGYGWQIDNLPADKFGKPLTQVHHGGGINGFNTYISRIIEDKYVIVIFNNTGGAPLSAMIDGITNILYGKAYQVAQKRNTVKLYDLINKQGLKQGITMYKAQQKSGFSLSEREMNSLGYQLLSLEKTSEAIAIFRLNVDAFPESANVYDSLAEAYLADGQKQQALRFYQKALALDNTNEHAKEVIEKLSAET